MRTILNNAAHRTIKSLSQDQFMRFKFSKYFVKDKYAEDGLLRFKEFIRNVVINDSHLNYDEFLYIGQLSRSTNIK